MPVERAEQLASASAARAQRNRGVGLLLIALGVAFFVAVFAALFVLWFAGFRHDVVAASVVPVALFVSVWLVTRGRRMRAGEAGRVLAEEVRAPIVYLRPFGADRAVISRRLSSRVRISLRESYESRYEERLARALHEVGPFVAVGDPTERLPQPGAVRMYAADEEWRETVDELTGRAGVVILHAGEGDGLAWEVRHVTELDAPERVILSLPLLAERKEPSRQERYDDFRRTLGQAFPRPLPEAIGHCQFLYFDADWTPRLLGERGKPLPAGESERARALRRLAREFKITWGPRWARVSVYVIVFYAVLWVLHAITPGWWWAGE
jgi:hypothetical protein